MRLIWTALAEKTTHERVSGPVPKGRLKIAQHAVLGTVPSKISPAGTTENHPGRQSWVYLQRTSILIGNHLWVAHSSLVLA